MSQMEAVQMQKMARATLKCIAAMLVAFGVVMYFLVLPWAKKNGEFVRAFGGPCGDFPILQHTVACQERVSSVLAEDRADLRVVLSHPEQVRAIAQARRVLNHDLELSAWRGYRE